MHGTLRPLSSVYFAFILEKKSRLTVINRRSFDLKQKNEKNSAVLLRPACEKRAEFAQSDAFYRLALDVFSFRRY